MERIEERTEELMRLLYEKAKFEYETFINDIMKLSPKEIINKASEITIKENIVDILENVEFSYDQAFALNELAHPLHSMYLNWIETEDDIMYQIEDSIRSLSSNIVKENFELETGQKVEVSIKENNEPVQIKIIVQGGMITDFLSDSKQELDVEIIDMDNVFLDTEEINKYIDELNSENSFNSFFTHNAKTSKNDKPSLSDLIDNAKKAIANNSTEIVGKIHWFYPSETMSFTNPDELIEMYKDTLFQQGPHAADIEITPGNPDLAYKVCVLQYNEFGETPPTKEQFLKSYNKKHNDPEIDR